MTLVMGSPRANAILEADRALARAREQDDTSCPNCQCDWQTAIEQGGKAEMKNWSPAPPDAQSYYYECGTGDLHITCGNCGTEWVMYYDNY